MPETIKAPALKAKREKSQAEKIDELMDYIKQGGSLGMEIEKRLEELPKKYAAILVTEQDKYDLLLVNLVKSFAKKGQTGIFVTLNKSGLSVLELLQKNRVPVEELLIVDAITKQGKQGNGSGRISYVGSPQDLTEMEAQIDDFVAKLPKGGHFLILDSLSTLLVYNADRTVEKFVHTLSEKLRSQGFKAVFTVMNGTRRETMDVLSQFCDKVIRTSPQIRP